jgi:2-pyrone-4,6-dicarboxylate lactonase
VPPSCQGPDAFIRPPYFVISAGACDTHAHVIGDPAQFPFVANRSYTPPVASETAYLGMLDALGMARGVLVQVSVHGTDNSAMVATLRRHPERLRGVAVVDPSVSDIELEHLHRSGVRGLRFNILFGGGVALDHLEGLAQRIAPLGWHIQLLIDARVLPELGPRLARLPVDVVIDHMGHMPAAVALGHDGFAWMLRLLDQGRTWVKLSGAYRLSAMSAQFSDTIPLARALVSAAAERCVWGSDWPHVAVTGPMFNTTDCLDLLGEWVMDPDVRSRILVENPARLYDFTHT